jgi:hypothetical protein
MISAEELQQLGRLAADGRVDWVDVAGYANRSCLAPALCTALADKGLSAAVPEIFKDYLDEIYRFNVTRNEALLEQLREVALLLNSIGVTPLLLKGGAALATGLFPDPGSRFMWDLDLLVPEEMLAESVAVLLANGYAVPEIYTQGVQGAVSWADSHHHPGLVCPGAPAKVELHWRLLIDGGELLQPGDIWERSRPYCGSLLPGASALLMSPTDELVYCFAHSELAHNHHLYERVDARHLQEFAYLCDRHRDRIDWGRLELLKQHPAYGDIFSSYLYLAKKLFRVDLPVSGNLGAEAERHYRRAAVLRNGWSARMHLLRMLFLELSVVFARERLQKLYPEEVSLFRLRLRHLRFLLGRYCRLEAWRVRLKGLQPF